MGSESALKRAAISSSASEESSFFGFAFFFPSMVNLICFIVMWRYNKINR